MEISKKCRVCGQAFIARSGNAKYCRDCRSCKSPKKNNKRLLPKLSLSEILKKLSRYNAEHHTCYTYGQFVELLDSGKIKE